MCFRRARIASISCWAIASAHPATSTSPSWPKSCSSAPACGCIRNKPYAGGFITQNHGAPQRGRHALQIEINRALYMNEATLEKTRNFWHLQDLLGRVIATLLAEVEHRFEPQRLAAE